MAKAEIQTASGHKTITREEILARLDDCALIVVNVMPKEAYAERHIRGSINLPIADIESKARLFISNPTQEMAVYCAGPT